MDLIDWLSSLLPLVILANGTIFWLLYQKQRRIQPPLENLIWLKYTSIFCFIMATLTFPITVLTLAVKTGVFLTK